MRPGLTAVIAETASLPRTGRAGFTGSRRSVTVSEATRLVRFFLMPVRHPRSRKGELGIALQKAISHSERSAAQSKNQFGLPFPKDRERIGFAGMTDRFLRSFAGVSKGVGLNRSMPRSLQKNTKRPLPHGSGLSELNPNNYQSIKHQPSACCGDIGRRRGRPAHKRTRRKSKVRAWGLGGQGN